MNDLIGQGRVFEPTGETLEKGFKANYNEYVFEEIEINHLLKGYDINILINDKALWVRLEKYKDEWQVLKAIPMITKNHIWTEKEKELLYNGEEVKVDDLFSKKTLSRYSAYIRFNRDTRKLDFLDEQRKKIFSK